MIEFPLVVGILGWVSILLFYFLIARLMKEKEMIYGFFYLWYFIKWLLELITYGSKSYHTNTFEREAFENEKDLTYLAGRRKFAWWKYL